MKDHYLEIFNNITRVLVIVAHPDDFEMIFAGTAARLIKDGKKVRLLVCTNGSPKTDKDVSENLVRTRKQEQLESARIIGIPENEVLILDNYDSSLVDTDEALLERIVFHMRSFRPDLIVTHQFQTVLELIEPDFLWVAHRDHRAVGIATMNAIMPMASYKHIYPEHIKQGLKPIEVYKLLIPDLVNGKVFVDINTVVGVKRQALKAHKSQIDAKYAEEIMDNHNLYLGQKNKEPYYIEKFRYFELGYKIDRKVYEEKLPV